MNKAKATPILLLFLYLVPRFFFFSWFETLPEYTGYFLEAVYCAVLFWVYREDLRFRFPLEWGNLFLFILQFFCGMVLFYFAFYAQFLIPWDFSDPAMVFALLVVSPILEEAIFRQALWVPLTKIFSRKRDVVTASAVLFAIAHGIVWFLVPAELRPFVLFQMIYTLFLGLFWGWQRLRTGSLLFVILLHLLFNSGFWIAERLTHL